MFLPSFMDVSTAEVTKVVHSIPEQKKLQFLAPSSGATGTSCRKLYRFTLSPSFCQVSCKSIQFPHKIYAKMSFKPLQYLNKFRFNLATLTFKALHNGHPPYLADLLQYHKTTKSTQSSASHLLSVPRHNRSFGSCAFHISALKIWNSLPPHILQSQTLDSFRRHLKTYYFQSANPAP